VLCSPCLSLYLLVAVGFYAIDRRSGLGSLEDEISTKLQLSSSGLMSIGGYGEKGELSW
jgi:hypothetical protein